MHPGSLSSLERRVTPHTRTFLAAMLCVLVAALVGTPAGAQTTPPSIDNVQLTSDPETGVAYGLGEEIEATVTFSDVVHVFEDQVRGMDRGQLHLLLTIGANARQADFCGGSGSTMLRFCYRVRTGDHDGDGVSIGNLSAALVGGSIQAADSTEAARAYNALPTQPGHEVDGVVPAVPTDGVEISSEPVSGDTYGFGEPIEVTVAFNEVVSVIGEPAIIITIGEHSRSAVFRRGSGTDRLIFRYLVRADDRDADGINISAGTTADGRPLSFVDGTVTDLAGNPANRSFAGLSADQGHKVDGGMDVDPPAVVVDGVAVTSAPGNYATGDPIDVTVTFDEPVYVTGNPTLALRIGTADRTAALVDGGNGRAQLRFRYRVRAGEVDADGIAIPANALALNGATIADRAGNAAQLFFPSPGPFTGHRVAAIAPFVRRVAFTSTPEDGATYQVGERITARVEFDDAELVVLGAPTLALAIGDPPHRRMAWERTTAGTLHFAYIVREGDMDTNGIDIPAGPDALAGGTLRDQAGNVADRGFSAVRASRHNVNGGTDNTAPTVVEPISIASTPENGHTYISGERIAIAVTFSEPVYVTGAPAIDVDIGVTTRAATTSAAEEARQLTFHYDIRRDDADANGISIGANAIRLSGGTIEDRTGNAATLTLRQLPDQSAHRVDATPPTIPGAPSIESVPPNGTHYRAGEVIRVAVSFDEVVYVAGNTPSLELVVGTKSRTMPYQEGSGTDALTFAWTVLPGEEDNNGVSLNADALSLNGGTLRDAVGNDAIVTHAALADHADHEVDGGPDAAPPSVQAVRVPGGPANPRGYFGRGDEIAVEVRFNEPIFVTDDSAELKFQIGGQDRTASYDSGDGTTVLRFVYRVDAIDHGAVVVPANDLHRNTATLEDASGKQASIAQPGSGNTGTQADGMAPRVDKIEVASDAGIDNTYKRGDTIEVKLTFTEPICVAHDPSLTLGIRIGGTTRRARLLTEDRNCDRDSLEFEYLVQQGDEDRDGIEILPDALAGGAITDRADNPADLRRAVLPAQAEHRVDSDIAGARVTIVSDPGDDDTYAAGDTIAVRVTFDETPVGNHDDSTLTLIIGNVAREAGLQEQRGAQFTYTYVVQAGDRDADGISVLADALRGSRFADPPTLAPILNSPNHRVDAVSPQAATAEIVSTPRDGDTYTADETIEVAVHFNEIVFVEANPRLRLAVGPRTPAARYVGGSGTDTLRFAYTVQRGDNDDDGIAIGANALVEGTIADAFGNTLDTAGRRLRALPAQPGHKVDTDTEGQAPFIMRDGVRITSTPRDGSTYAIDEVIEVQVEFSAAVNVLEVRVVDGQQVELERPVLELEMVCVSPPQTVSRFARLAPEDDAGDTLTFRYTIVEGDCADSLAVPDNADSSGERTALTGGTIVDYADGENEAIRKHDRVPTTHRVDAVRPRVQDVVVVSRGTYGLGDTIEVEVRFREPIYVSGQPTLRLDIGRGSREALFAGVQAWSSPLTTGVEHAALVFHYVVRSGDSDDDGISIGPDALRGGTIADRVGNTWTERRLPAKENTGGRVEGESDFLPPVITDVEFASDPDRCDATDMLDRCYGLNDNIDVEVTFSEPVFLVAGTPNVPIAIGAESRPANYLTGSGSNKLRFRYLVRLGDHDDDGISIGPNAIFGGTIQDKAGNAAVLTFHGLEQDENRKVIVDADQEAPSVEEVLVGDAPGGRVYGLGDVIELRVRMSERVTVTGQPAITLSVGPNDRRAVYANGSGTDVLVFRYVVQAGDVDDDGITVASTLTGGAIADFSGNPAVRAFTPLGPLASHRVDARRPAAQRVAFDSTGPYALGDSILADVHFSETVHVSDPPVLTLAIGDLARPARYQRGSGTPTLRFAYQVRGGDRDEDGISVGPDALVGGVIEDAAGNDWGEDERRLPAVRNQRDQTVDAGVGVDGDAPYVTHVGISSTPRRSAYQVDEPIEVQVWFNEAVWVTEGTATVRLRIGPALREATLHRGSGSNRLTFRYRVQSLDVAREGVSIGPLNTALSGTIVDESGNAAIRDFGPLAASAGHKVDAVRPNAQSIAILSQPAAQDVYGLGEIISLEVRFNEDVWVEADAQGAEPALELDMGRDTVAARFVEGSGSNTLEFRYIVGTGDFDQNGIAIGPDALRGGVIRDGAGNEWGEAERRVPALPTQSGHRVNAGTDVDPAIVRGVWLASTPEREDTYALGAVIEARIRFSEVVHVTGTPSLALSIGPSLRQARYAGGSGSEVAWAGERVSVLAFRYTVQLGDLDEDGISIGPGPGALTGGAIRDQGGNGAVRDFASLPADRFHKVDAVPPAVAAAPRITSTPGSAETYKIGETISVAIDFDDAVQVSGEPLLGLQVGAATREAAFIGGHGTRTLTFDYTVQEGDLDADGVSIRADALRGGAITDAVGNPAVRTLPALGPQSGHRVDGVVATATVSVTSSPASGDTYRADEDITVAVTFSEPVEVETAAGLRLALTVGSATRPAAFVRRNEDRRTLAFRYTVAYGDFDANGVSVQGEALTGGGALADVAGNPVRRTLALADQAGHKVDTSVTLALSEVALLVGGAPVDINLGDVIAYAGLYQTPVSSDTNVAVASVSGHRLTITPVAEGNATITVTAASTAEIVLNIPVVVTASPAEVAVLTHTLAAMGRGMLASAAHTIGTRLELGPQQRRMSLLVGGRRFDGAGAGESPPVWPSRSGFDHPHGLPGGMAAGFGGWPGDSNAGAPWPTPPGGPNTPFGRNDPFNPGTPPSHPGTFGGAEQMWRGTAFEMPLLGVGRGSAWSLWGGGDFAAFAGEPDENTYDGNLAAMYIGMDGRGQGWVAGGAVGRVSADASYEYKDAHSTGKGSLETSLTTFHPYLGWSLAERGKAWVIVGFGRGEASMQRDGRQYVAEPTDLSMRMGLVGARGTLDEPGGLDIALRADAGTLSLETGTGPKAIDALEVAVQRARLGVELSYTADTGPMVGGVRLSGAGGSAGRFTPFLEIGARFDGGDGPSGTGAEVGVGARYESPTVSFEAKARTLAMHGADGYTETGASATLAVSPRGAGGRGLRLSVSPSWGGASEATDVFFRRDYAAQAAQRHTAGAAYDDWRMNARVGYGMPLRGRPGTVTPFAETDLASSGGKRARVGFAYETRTTHGTPLRFDVAGERAQGARGTEHRVLVRAEGRF